MGALALLVVAGALYFMNDTQSQRPNPVNGSIYYSGPFQSKSDPTRYATDDGKIVPAPAGANGAAGSGVPNQAEPRNDQKDGKQPTGQSQL